MVEKREIGDSTNYTLEVEDVEHLRRGNSLELEDGVEVSLTATYWDKMGEPRPDQIDERDR